VYPQRGKDLKSYLMHQVFIDRLLVPNQPLYFFSINTRIQFMKNNCQKTYFKNPLTFLLVIVVFFSCVRALNYGGQKPGIDFYQFWVVGKAVSQFDVNNIYSDVNKKEIGFYYFQKSKHAYSQEVNNLLKVSDKQITAANLRKELETYSTPFLYTVFYFITSNNYDFDIQFFLVLSLVLYVYAIIALCRLMGYHAHTILVFIPIFTIFFRPLFSDIRVANVNQIQMAMLILFLCIQSRPSILTNLAGGFVLGLSVMFKPNLVFVVLMLVIAWIINRRFEKLVLELMGISIAIIVAVTTSSLFFGSSLCWFQWYEALIIIPNEILLVSMGNYSLSRLIFDFTDINVSKYFIFVLLLLTSYFVYRSRRKVFNIDLMKENNVYEQDLKAGFLEDVATVSTGALIFLLSSSLVWLHYFILVIPAIIYIFRPENYLSQNNSIGKLIVIKRFLPAIALLLVSNEPLLRLSSIIQVTPHFTAAAICSGTLIFYFLMLWELKHLREYLKS
jgi:hypothetical protein